MNPKLIIENLDYIGASLEEENYVGLWHKARSN